MTKPLARWQPLPDCPAPVWSLSGGWVFFYDWFEAESRNMAEPAPERYRGGPTLSRRRGRLCEYSPCRYSGRAICRFSVSYGLPLSACLQGAEGWRGTLFLLAKSVTARSERKLVRLIGLWEYWRTRGGSRQRAESVGAWLSDCLAPCWAGWRGRQREGGPP